MGEVTEVKGHTLRGKLMWKSTLAGFAKTDSELLSTLGPDRLDRFKIQVSAEAGADQDSDILTGTV